ncbi:putative necrosis-inducing factor-domain-containing protein [Podospora appendiculata]|uniref:Necrosis-inducing factor-domain-containing protein n=1 Tax=Podospora appendiculata TaxID=314037 RepID=A0AAE0XAB5_9PEZI|nr:putative necrosis-inducing factor-domain-containing protein [Podospora appendiculata]
MLLARLTIAAFAAAASVQALPACVHAPTAAVTTTAAVPHSPTASVNVIASPTINSTFSFHASHKESSDDWVSDCDSYTYANQVSQFSPLVSDCQVIVENIINGGEWTVFEGFRHQLVQYGTCAFSVQGLGALGVVQFLVGNSDISDVISESVFRFAWTDPHGNLLVGSKGNMNCQGTLNSGTEPVIWGIYHT